MPRSIRLFVGSVALVAGCALFTEPGGGSVVATPRPPELELTNNTLRSIYFSIFDARTLALINWGACTDPRRCPAVAPQGSLLIPYDKIGGVGLSRGTPVVVYWWHLVARDAGFAPDSVRAIGVTL